MDLDELKLERDLLLVKTHVHQKKLLSDNKYYINLKYIAECVTNVGLILYSPSQEIDYITNDNLTEEEVAFVQDIKQRITIIQTYIEECCIKLAVELAKQKAKSLDDDDKYKELFAKLEELNNQIKKNENIFNSMFVGCAV